MKWVVFQKTMVRLVVAGTEDDVGRVAIALPKSGAPLMVPSSAEGRKFSELGFRYQERNNAWYRRTAGISVGNILKAFDDDAGLQEVPRENVYLTLASTNQGGFPEKSKQEQRDVTRSNSGETSSRRTTNDGERSDDTNRGTSSESISADKPPISERHEPNRANGAGGEESSREDRQRIGNNDRDLDGKREARDRDTSSDGDASHDPATRARSSDGNSSSSTSPRQSALKEAAVARGNYLPKERGVTRAYSTLSQRYSQNMESLELITALSKQDRPPTEAELEILIKFSGWGGLLDQLSNSDNTPKLLDQLGRRGLHDARESALSAFYTPESLASGIWDLLESKGYRGGRVLETSAGSGVFLNQRLPDYDSKQHFTAVEMESTTSSILRLTNSSAWVLSQPLERTNLPSEAFDLVTGNFPFGEFKVTDSEIPGSLSIHNYFLKKSLSKVREGGIVAVLTSTWTLDAERSDFRRDIASQADLISAIRLPGGVFKGSQTDAPCDFLVFKKRNVGEPYNGLPFEELTDCRFPCSRDLTIHPKGMKPIEYQKGDEAEISLNSVFSSGNGGVLVGTPEAVTNRFGDRAELRLSADIEIVLEALRAESVQPGSWFDSKNTFSLSGHPKKDLPESKVVNGEPPLVGSFVLGDANSVRVISNVVPGEKEYEYSVTTTKAKIPATQYERVTELVHLRDLTRELIAKEASEATSESELSALRATLNNEYDSFVEKNGFLNSKANRRWLRKDSAGAYLLGLEIYDAEEDKAEKSTIFHRRSVRPELQQVNADDLRSAVAICFGKHGRIHPPAISQLLGKDFDVAIREEPNVLLKDPETSTYMLREVVLSGNVRKKLLIAKRSVESDTRLTDTVTALEGVMPLDIPAEDISISLASTWIPSTYIVEFAKYMYAKNGIDGVKLEVHRVITGDVEFRVTSHGKAGHELVENVEHQILGTSKRSFGELIVSAMRNQQVKVTTFDSEAKKTIELKEATFEANRILDELKDAFAEWIWQDATRTEHLESLFNTNFNSYHSEEFLPSGYRFQGLSHLWSPRPHQESFVVRALMTGNSMAAHCVGAGKTMEMVMLQLEKKRLGIARKPSISVPNHMLYQLAGEAQSMYPSAKIALIGKEDLEKSNRQAMLARIAMNDWDLVILTHGVMGRVPVPSEFQASFLMDEVDRLEEALRSVPSKSFTSRRIAAALKRKRTRIRKVLDSQGKKAETVSWDMLGIDHLAVDEAHLFKNLELDTAMSLPGVSGSASDRAWSLYVKSRYLMKINGGREVGLDFFTGTPITNSMSELYTMHRYLRPSVYDEMNIRDFGAWAGVFGEVKTELEMLPEGGGFHMKSRLSKFVNLPELLRGFRVFTDIKMREDLNLPVPSYKEHTEVAKKSHWQSLYMEDLTLRATKVRQRTVDNTKDNLLKIVGDGRRAAMDMRLIEPTLPREESTKLALATDNLLKVYHKTHDLQGVQLIFCDVSTPGPNKTYDAYNDVKGRLREAGVPEDEIAFIHDANSDQEKLSLFKKVRAGVVRFLFGSTEKMGTGTNVQDRLAALHDLDAPWRPADLEQRMGRIVRQGNLFSMVDIYRYTTEDSFDLFMWENNKRKATYISQIMRDPNTADRTMSEDAEINFAEVVAVTTGNPAIREKVQVDAEVAKLQRKEAAYYAAQSRGVREAERSKEKLDTVRQSLVAAKRDTERLNAYRIQMPSRVDFALEVIGPIADIQDGTTTWLDRKVAAKALYSAMASEALLLDKGGISNSVGMILGVSIQVERSLLGGLHVQLDLESNSDFQVHETPHHNLRRLVELVSYDVPNQVPHYQSRITELEDYLNSLSARSTGDGFPDRLKLDELRERQNELNDILSDSATSEIASLDAVESQYEQHIAEYLLENEAAGEDYGFAKLPKEVSVQPDMACN